MLTRLRPYLVRLLFAAGGAAVLLVVGAAYARIGGH
jgi:hypothetical protein